MEHDLRGPRVCVSVCTKAHQGIIAEQTANLAFSPPDTAHSLCCLSMSSSHWSPVTAGWQRCQGWKAKGSKVSTVESLSLSLSAAFLNPVETLKSSRWCCSVSEAKWGVIKGTMRSVFWENDPLKLKEKHSEHPVLWKMKSWRRRRTCLSLDKVVHIRVSRGLEKGADED